MASSIPAANANLKSLLQAAFATNEAVTVYKGKKLTKFISPQTIEITGWTGDQEPAELGPSYRREETFAIHIKITTFAGDQDFDSREVEAMSLFGTISVLIANNWTLPSTAGGSDGAVRFAEPGTFSFLADEGPAGQSIGTLTFDVHCSQRIQSLV